jgi:hypothetical protein
MKLYGYMLSLCFCVLLPSVVAAFGGAATKTVTHYNVSSRGFTVGNVTTTQRSSDDGGITNVHFETKTAVNASFLWIGFHLDMLEKGAIHNGELVSYSRKGRENGENIDIAGRLEHSVFRFDVHEHGTLRSVVIPRSSYDYTTMECPEARLDFSDKTHIALRILDVERMVVVKREYHFVQNTSYSIGDKEYPCRLIEFSDPNKKATRWINWDGTAIVMYRQDSKGEKYSYTVQASSLTREM